MMATSTPDQWRVLRCQLGERKAFEELVRDGTAALLYYATKLLKDESQAFDVLQEVWTTVLRGIRKLQDPKSLRPWLYRITYGCTIDRIRQDISTPPGGADPVIF